MLACPLASSLPGHASRIRTPFLVASVRYDRDLRPCMSGVGQVVLRQPGATRSEQLVFLLEVLRRGMGARVEVASFVAWTMKARHTPRSGYRPP